MERLAYLVLYTIPGTVLLATLLVGAFYLHWVVGLVLLLPLLLGIGGLWGNYVDANATKPPAARP